jgi:hypothetical protein
MQVPKCRLCHERHFLAQRCFESKGGDASASVRTMRSTIFRDQSSLPAPPVNLPAPESRSGPMTRQQPESHVTEDSPEGSGGTVGLVESNREDSACPTCGTRFTLERRREYMREYMKKRREKRG